MIAGGHKILRQGIRSLIISQEGFEVVAESSDGPGTVKETIQHKPDVVLMDIKLFGLNGLEVTKQITVKLSECKVLIFSLHWDNDHVLEVFEGGASGYISKDFGVEEMLAAIRVVHNNQYYLSPSISSSVVGSYLEKTKKKKCFLASKSRRSSHV